MGNSWYIADSQTCGKRRALHCIVLPSLLFHLLPPLTDFLQIIQLKPRNVETSLKLHLVGLVNDT